MWRTLAAVLVVLFAPADVDLAFRHGLALEPADHFGRAIAANAPAGGARSALHHVVGAGNLTSCPVVSGRAERFSVRVVARRASPPGSRLAIFVVAAHESAEIAHHLIAGAARVDADSAAFVGRRPWVAIVAIGSLALAADLPLASIFPGAGGRSASIGDPFDRLTLLLVVRRLSRIVPSMRSAGSCGLLLATTNQREDNFAGYPLASSVGTLLVFAHRRGKLSLVYFSYDFGVVKRARSCQDTQLKRREIR